MGETNNGLKWGSNASFLLATLGAALGIGKFWRFPYELYTNGGGSFLLPYIVAILLVGLPFIFLEYGLGYKFHTSFTKVLIAINERFEYLGWLIVVIVFAVLPYYICIIAWDAVYFFLSFTKGWGSNPNAFFTNSVLQSSSGLSGLSHVVIPILLVVLGIWFIVWFISHRDVEKGIARAVKFLLPCMFIMVIFFVFYSFSLPGAAYGLTALFTPKWSTLLDFNVWISAFGQVLFSLSLGEGIAMTYASYVSENSKLADNGLTVVLVNSGLEIFISLGIFSILGFMAVSTAQPISSLVTQGTGLAFVAYPTILNLLGVWAYVIGPLFFLSIFFAGLGSTISFIEPLSSSLTSKFGIKRTTVVTCLCIIGVFLSLIFTTGAGNYVLGIVDEFLNNFALMIGVILQAIIFGWIYGIDKLIPILNHKSNFQVGRLWVVTIKYLIPIILVFIWLGGLGSLLFSHDIIKLGIDLVIAVVLIIIPMVLTFLPSKKDEKVESKS